MSTCLRENPTESLPPTISDVAELTLADIQSMTTAEMIQVIEVGAIPFVDESRLASQDKQTLQRLAILARNSCQSFED